MSAFHLKTNKVDLNDYVGERYQGGQRTREVTGSKRKEKQK